VVAASSPQDAVVIVACLHTCCVEPRSRARNQVATKMKVFVKTLTNEQFEVEVGETDTVRAPPRSLARSILGPSLRAPTDDAH
jgi:hypothetical protein